MLTGLPYDSSVDIWALGCILCELVTGLTPFSASNKDKLLKSINLGYYKVATQGEPVYIETLLFLLGSLQINQEIRFDADSLLAQPLIAEEFSAFKLHILMKTS